MVEIRHCWGKRFWNSAALQALQRHELRMPSWLLPSGSQAIAEAISKSTEASATQLHGYSCPAAVGKVHSVMHLSSLARRQTRWFRSLPVSSKLPSKHKYLQESSNAQLHNGKPFVPLA